MMTRFFTTGTTIATFVLAVALVCPVARPAAAQTDGFKELKRTKDGIIVSRKPGRTKGFYVLRFESTSPVSPERLISKAWDTFAIAMPPVKERRFIKRGADELVFYDRVATPVVSDRDYTMKINRVSNGEVLRLDFGTTDQFGPPPDPAYVRMGMVKGYWQAEPDGQGGSKVRYEVYSEPGGSIPAAIVRDAMLKEALGDYRRTLKDVRK